MSDYVLAVGSYDDQELHPVRLLAWPGPSVGPVGLPEGMAISSATGLAFSADGGWLATAHDAYNDADLRVFDTATWSQVGAPTANSVRDPIFAPSGAWLAARGYDAVMVFDTASWAPLVASPVAVGGEAVGMTMSPDGARLAVAIDAYPNGQIVLIDTATWTLSMAATTAVRAVSLAWAPNGDWLAVGLEGNADHLAIIYATADWSVVASLPGDWVMGGGLAWSADSTRLAVAGDDSALRVYDSATWAPIAVTPMGAYYNRLAYAPDGSRIHAGSSAGLVTYATSDWSIIDSQDLQALALALSPAVTTRAVAGTIRDHLGNPCARPVHLLRRDDLALLSSTTSDATTGAYRLETFLSTECLRVAIDTTGDYNDLVARVLPA